ncbi:hypothetical protein D3227_35080 [Mesorhizobium waimense]|uniref:Uncharacterized protein n=1 Tax=Mesorhizobium waimense TaxID=1300307 RepID=A0A3A5JYK1_9HYPH|nr:hypothetical protein [Mesorhizobium waimense]RJT28121.1 hypothetical protein D3227_35080 [Mesorhizobium waimense]
MSLPEIGFFPRALAVTVPLVGVFDMTSWDGIRAWLRAYGPNEQFAISNEDEEKCRLLSIN